MGSWGWQEWLVVLVIVVVIFGTSKLAGVGKASGQAIRDFKDAVKGPDDPSKTAANVTPEQAAQAANMMPNQAPALGGTPMNPPAQPYPGQPYPGEY